VTLLDMAQTVLELCLIFIVPNPLILGTTLSFLLLLLNQLINSNCQQIKLDEKKVEGT
jgi:hypothetical protein